MYNLFALTLLLLGWNISGTLADEHCHKLLRELAQNQSAFVYCSTVHSVPVNVCIACEVAFSDMQTRYLILRENKNCTNDYFDKDRINLVSTMQSILAGLWAKAYCDDCFNSNNSYVFDLKKQNFLDCLKDNKGQECVSCLNDYINLNSFYVSLDKNNDGKVCYDLQDAMNRTRAHWSKELGCCHREFDKLLFVVVCSIVAILPLVFYGTTFALTKRQERNHGILIEDAYNNRLPRSINPNSSVADLPSTSSTATCPRVPTPKNKFNADDDVTSSDDSDSEATPTSIKKFNKSE
ncbi:osteopetrosis-associated transmembrane protein 1 [Eurosta solidaginis]|uniref:osteopetrosis-associated transmembrane protein 1 n=1 Tax=Eurosta solidaginis TaxID=178769 RepID=UPI0035305BBB